MLDSAYRFLAALPLTFVLAACGADPDVGEIDEDAPGPDTPVMSPDDATEAVPDDVIKTPIPTDQGDVPVAVETASDYPDLKIEILVEGAEDAPALEAGGRGKFWYEGVLRDGRQFDGNLGRPNPTEFQLGSVIKGWNLGLVGMKVGEKRRLTVPGHLAYGDRGSPPRIGPNATLVFTVELAEIVDS